VSEQAAAPHVYTAVAMQSVTRRSDSLKSYIVTMDVQSTSYNNVTFVRIQTGEAIIRARDQT